MNHSAPYSSPSQHAHESRPGRCQGSWRNAGQAAAAGPAARAGARRAGDGPSSSDRRGPGRRRRHAERDRQGVDGAPGAGGLGTARTPWCPERGSPAPMPPRLAPTRRRAGQAARRIGRRSYGPRGRPPTPGPLRWSGSGQSGRRGPSGGGCGRRWLDGRAGTHGAGTIRSLTRNLGDRHLTAPDAISAVYDPEQFSVLTLCL